jgi:putative FmdB family regulatory protein
VPIYEFICESLDCEYGWVFERILPVSQETPEGWCPRCNAPGRFLVSRSSFILSGSGWAKDGYSHAPTPKEAC